MWIWGKTTGKMFNWSSLATGDPKRFFYWSLSFSLRCRQWEIIHPSLRMWDPKGSPASAKEYQHPHFTEEETEAYKGKAHRGKGGTRIQAQVGSALDHSALHLRPQRRERLVCCSHLL